MARRKQPPVGSYITVKLGVERESYNNTHYMVQNGSWPRVFFTYGMVGIILKTGIPAVRASVESRKNNGEYSLVEFEHDGETHTCSVYPTQMLTVEVGPPTLDLMTRIWMADNSLQQAMRAWEQANEKCGAATGFFEHGEAISACGLARSRYETALFNRRVLNLRLVDESLV